MADVLVPLAVLVALAVATPLVARRRGAAPSPFHPAVAFALPYAFITAGPAVRWLVFGVVPYGIHLDMLGRALWVAVAAQAGIALGCTLGAGTTTRLPRRWLALRQPRRFRTFALAAFGVAFALAAVALAARWGDLAVAGKLDAGAGDNLWVRVHYAAFLLLLALLPAVAIVDQALERRPLPRRSAIVLGSFALLCLLEGERDVALVLLMIPIGWAAARPGPRRRPRVGLWRSALRVGAAFLIAAVVLVGLEWARSGGSLSWSSQTASIAAKAREESVVQSVLGLGSNLFVTSRVVEWVPREIPHRWGETYLHTAANLLPSFLLPGLRYDSLLAWFKERYAPTSSSGYGFGMEAEAYLNFGLLGPVLVFALWAAALCRLFEGYRALPDALLYRYGYTFMLPFSLYCIRGDSLMWAKGFLYATGAVWLLARAAGVRRLVRHRRTRRPRATMPAPTVARAAA